jgi:AraC-like DNA-binding protein
MPAPAAGQHARRGSFATADPEEAHWRAEALMTRHRMQLVGDREAFRAEVEADEFDGFGVMTFGYGAEVEIVSAALQDFMTIHVPLAGSLSVRHRGQSAQIHRRCAAIFSADGEVVMRWRPGLRLLVLKLDRRDVEDRLHGLLGEPASGPLSFDVAAPLSPGRPLGAVAGLVRRAFRAAGPAGPSPVLRAELKQATLGALLLGQPHSHTDAIFAAKPFPAPRALRLALELIHDAEPAAVLSAADIARHAGVSERTLYGVFRRRFGVSATAYLRRERLERAHAELAAPDRCTTVAEVAARNGFAHPSRFAAAYRARFGELPSQTLMRSAPPGRRCAGPGEPPG